MRIKLRTYTTENRVVLTDFRGRLHAARGEPTTSPYYVDRVYEITPETAGQATAALLAGARIPTILSILESES